MKQRKDGRWLRVVTVNGKKNYFYSDADTESKAEKDIRRQIMAFEKKKEESVSFRSVAERWETLAYETIAHGTMKNYKPSVQDLINRFGDIPCSDIGAPDILQYFSSLSARGYAAKTVANRKSVLNLIMKHAIGEGIITNNPVPELSIPKKLKREQRRALEEWEIEVIKQNKSKGYWGFFAFFAMSTGCRIGEAFAAKYGDIDYENKTWHICRTVEHHGNAGIIKNHTKTDAGMRFVPLTNELLSVLADGEHKRTDLIFPDPINGGIITNSHITTGWNSFRFPLGIYEVTPHMLRHTYATMLYDADIDIKTAQYLLGHADAQTTLKIYTHLSQKRRAKGNEEVRKKIGEILQ